MAYSSLTSLTTWWHKSAHSQLAARLQMPKPLKQSLRQHPPVTAAAQRSSKSLHRSCRQQTHTNRHSCQAAGDHIADVFDVNSADTNQLQTALNRAIAAEDYALASQVRDKLQAVVGGDNGTADWRHLGVPEWLADRVERMGFKYATGRLHMTAVITWSVVYNFMFSMVSAVGVHDAAICCYYSFGNCLY